ncbi:hypothetical protein K3495_g15763, partial [Podosphaera aphanis]
VPTHSRPSKSNKVNKTNFSNKSAVVAVPQVALAPVRAGKQTQISAPNIPSKPVATGNSWATVVRNGHKKVRASTAETSSAGQNKPNEQQKLSTPKKVLHQPLRSNVSGIYGKKQQAPTKFEDKRLFLRLPLEHDWRKLSPAGIREVVVKKMAISPAHIGLIKPIRSGFALSPSNPNAREALLQAANGLFLTGAKLVPAENLVPLLIPTVPAFIYTDKGRVVVTHEMLSDEIERVSSVRPTTVKLFGSVNNDAPHRTWLGLFSKAPRPGFRVFDESGLAKVFKKQDPIDFCKRCNGHHSTRNCSRAPSCGNCGSTMHTQDACQALTRCRNCGGPHRSDSHRCLARPTRTGPPTKEQLKIFRQAGDREYQAVVRAKAAEARASTAEEAANAVNCSQNSKTANNETPEPPAD